MVKCNLCKKDISFFNTYVKENKYYCSNCWKNNSSEINKTEDREDKIKKNQAELEHKEYTREIKANQILKLGNKKFSEEVAKRSKSLTEKEFDTLLVEMRNFRKLRFFYKSAFILMLISIAFFGQIIALIFAGLGILVQLISHYKRKHLVDKMKELKIV